VDAGQQLPAEEAAAAANETLAAAEVQLLDRVSSTEDDGGGVRRGAAATAALPQTDRTEAAGGNLGNTDLVGGGALVVLGMGRTALLWGAFVVVVVAVCLLQRRAVWRKLSPRGRVFVRRRTASPV